MKVRFSIIIAGLLMIFQIWAKKPVSLENFGSTCYLNSIIQCLYNIDVITNFALFTYRIDPYPSGSLASLYLKLIHAMNNLQLLPENSAGYAQAEQKFRDNELTNFVHKARDIMRSCGQQDALEFFTRLVDGLILQDKRYPVIGTSQAVHIHPLGKNIKIETEETTTETTTSPAVKYESTTTVFYHLSLRVRKIFADGSQQLFNTLETCLDDYFASEKFDGYTSEGKLAQFDFKISLTELSDVVILALDRFSNFVKLDQDIVAPLTMNFRKYFTATTKNKPMYNYDLIAAAEHIGGTTLGGHYVAHIKDVKSGQWYYCSDATIQAETQEAAQSGINKSYILVYRKNEKKPV